MDTKTYTAIPDTSDSDYWDLKAQDASGKLKTFVPKDAELHRSLLQKQWNKIQAGLPAKDRRGYVPRGSMIKR